MLKGISRHPVKSLIRESLSRFFTNNNNVGASPSLEAKTTCLCLYQKLFQSLRKYGQRKAKWITSSFSMLYSRHLSSLLICSQGIPDCSLIYIYIYIYIERERERERERAPKLKYRELPSIPQ